MRSDNLFRCAVVLCLAVAAFGCSGSSGEDGGVDGGGGGGGGSDSGTGCTLDGTWGVTHAAAGGVTISDGVCADTHSTAFGRTGGGFPTAYATGTFDYDAANGTVVITNTAAASADPNFDGCVGVPGTYQLAFTDCSHFSLTKVTDACAVRVMSMGNGATLTKGPLPAGMSCTATGIDVDAGALAESDGGTGTDAGSMGGDGGTSCTITLSGGVSKTIMTCSVSASYDGTNTGFSITTPPVSGSTPELSFAAKIAGLATTGTAYDANNSVSQGGVIFESATSIWTMDSSKGTGAATLQFSSLTPGQMSGGSTAYTAHGTLTATYASTGSSGNVTVNASF